MFINLSLFCFVLKKIETSEWSNASAITFLNVWLWIHGKMKHTKTIIQNIPSENTLTERQLSHLNIFVEYK